MFPLRSISTACAVRWLVFVVLWSGVTGAGAASYPYWHTSMVHTAWTKQDGAPTAAFDMAQDHRDMLWFAAGDGLHRFDGVHFERLTAIDGNKLRSSNTNALLVVGTALWVGYNFGGVSVFDQGRVRHYDASDGLPERSVYRLARTAKGVVWLSASTGLYWLEGQRWRHVEPEDGLPAGDFHYFTVLPDQTVLAYHPDGMYRSTPGGHRFSRVLAGKDIEIGHLRPDGDVLLVSTEHKLYRYAPATGALTPLHLPDGDQPFGVFLDQRGAMWINTDAGVKLLTPDLRTQRAFYAPNNLSGKLIYNAFDDREGNLWFTTENGVDRVRESRLTTIALPPRMFSGLSVQADGDGAVWVGNFQSTGNYEQRSFGLLADGTRQTTPLLGVTATTRAPDGSAWFASGLTLWHRAAGRWQSWPLPPDLRGHDVQALAMDASGRLWVSVMRKGVHVFRDGQWQPGGGIAALATRTSVSLLADARGRVWFGYPGNRLAVLDGATVREYGPGDGLEVGNITVMVADPGSSGGLWVCGDQGVGWFDGRRFTALQGEDGTALGGGSGMALTRGGELWLHGADGLTRVAAADLARVRSGALRLPVERFNHLDGHEGKPAPLRPLSALTEAADGRLWYATSGSVGWIDPAHIVRNRRPPAAQVLALRTDREQYRPISGQVLPRRTRNLEVDFTAAGLSVPERIRFRFRLRGLEQDWRDAGARRQAFYTSLGPGDYRFEVIAANEDGVWSTVPGAVAFRIEAAFVQTIWFKLLCGAAAIVLLLLCYWWRLALVTRRISERLRERLGERQRIARTLHDNFLQSVEALMLQFDRIKHGLAPDDPARASIDRSLDTAEEVLNEGRAQVLELRIGHELSGDLDTALSQLGHSLAPRHDAQFCLTVRGTARPLRTAVAAEAYAIAREALLNACRHAHSATVTVDLHYAPRHFTLTVDDRGRGLPAEVSAQGHRPGHWGLTGMRERASDVGGTLHVDSAPGSGTRVTLRVAARRAYARSGSLSISLSSVTG